MLGSLDMKSGLMRSAFSKSELNASSKKTQSLSGIIILGEKRKPSHLEWDRTVVFRKGMIIQG